MLEPRCSSWQPDGMNECEIYKKKSSDFRWAVKRFSLATAGLRGFIWFCADRCRGEAFRLINCPHRVEERRGEGAGTAKCSRVYPLSEETCAGPLAVVAAFFLSHPRSRPLSFVTDLQVITCLSCKKLRVWAAGRNSSLRCCMMKTPLSVWQNSTGRKNALTTFAANLYSRSQQEENPKGNSPVRDRMYVGWNWKTTGNPQQQTYRHKPINWLHK